MKGHAVLGSNRRVAAPTWGFRTALTRSVITALDRQGIDLLDTKNVAIKLIDEQSIVSGSLLTVESNHFCVLKGRGAILDVYETAQYPLQTPDKPLFDSISQGFFSGG